MLDREVFMMWVVVCFLFFFVGFHCCFVFIQDVKRLYAGEGAVADVLQ